MRADGTYEARISAAPVNYRDGRGDWRPIDNRLRRLAGGSYENRANSFAVRIPSDAADPVRVTSAGHSIQFSMKGADGAATVAAAGADATFNRAMSGVDATYEVLSGGLKETLRLSSADAPTTYTFVVDAPGLSARSVPSGAVVFVDARGVRRFEFAPPWMQDATGELSRDIRYEVRHVGDRDVVDLVLDRTWLLDRARRFPVMVDPTVWAGTDGVCELVSGWAANVSQCAANMSTWIGRSGREVHRAAVWVDPAAVVPRDAIVLGAQLDALFVAQSVDEPSQMRLHWLTNEFDYGATWNSAGPGHSWTTPGGDLEATPQATRSVLPHQLGGSIPFAVPRLTQSWLERRRPINGVLIKAADESRQHVDVLEDFTLKVRYHERTGFVAQDYTFDTYELPDGSDLSVNLGNGNLFFSSEDVGFDGYDGRFPLGRVWNTFVTGPFDGGYGADSRGDYTAIALEENWVDGSMILYGPGASDTLFVKRADGTYESPDGLDGALVRRLDGTMTLTFADGEVWTFDGAPDRRLLSARDPNGYTITLDYAAGRLSDGQGRHETADVRDGRIATVTDESGARNEYAYDAAGRLLSRRDPAGSVTTYLYDLAGRIARIEFANRPGLRFQWGINVFVNGRNQGGPSRPFSDGKGAGYTLHGTLASIHAVSTRRPARRLRYGDRVRFLGFVTAISGDFVVVGRLDIKCTVRR